MPDDRKAVEGAIDYAVLQGGAAPTSRIGAAGWIQGVGYDWLTGRINSGSSLGAEGSILNKLIQAGFGGTFIVPFNDKGSGEVDLVPLVGTGSATFTRATTATTVNSAGLIVNLGLNLCLQSQDFSNAKWLVSNSTVTANNIAAPDGTTTGNKILETVAVGTHQVIYDNVTPITISSATVYTLSVFAKAGLGRDWFRFGDGSGNLPGLAYFNLTTGAVGTVTSGTATITSVGNGWYRCTVTSTSAGTTCRPQIATADSDGNVSYAGDITKGLYAWGAQLEVGSAATAYAATTASANSAARSYYDPTTLQYLGYLSEGARTNLCLQSQDLATTWTTSNTTVSTNQTTAPDATSTADAVLEAATTTTHFVNQSITISASTTYAFSVFVKGLNRTWCAIEMIGVDAAGRFAYFNLSGAGSVGTTSGTTSTQIKAYPNGWYRCTIVADSGIGAGTGAVRVYPATADNTATFLGNTSNGVYAWGAQLEAGSFASTYIPTTTASAPRNADVLTYPTSGNVSGTVGTIYGEMAGINDTSVSKVLMSVDGSNSTFSRVGGGANTPYLYDGAFRGPGPTISSPTSLNKLAFSWGSSSAISVNGSVNSGLGFDGDLGAGANMSFNALSTGANNNFGTIRNFRIYQTQLSASQLQALTA